MRKGEREYYLEKANEFGWGPRVAKLPSSAKLLVSFVKGKKVLDLGCGSGLWVDYLSKEGYQATGIDFVSEFIGQAKKNYQGSFLEGRAEKLPLKNNSFETVFLLSVLEHLEDQERVLKEIRRVGKRLILVVPQETPEVLIRRGLVFKHHLDQTHKRVYTKKEITRLLKKMGFKIIHLQEIERLPSISIFPSLFKAPQVFKRILTRLFFWIFQEENYYLELLVVADRIKNKR